MDDNSGGDSSGCDNSGFDFTKFVRVIATDLESTPRSESTEPPVPPEVDGDEPKGVRELDKEELSKIFPDTAEKKGVVGVHIPAGSSDEEIMNIVEKAIKSAIAKAGPILEGDSSEEKKLVYSLKTELSKKFDKVFADSFIVSSEMIENILKEFSNSGRTDTGTLLMQLVISGISMYPEIRRNGFPPDNVIEDLAASNNLSKFKLYSELNKFFEISLAKAVIGLMGITFPDKMLMAANKFNRQT
jgi:hypothetical protein